MLILGHHQNNKMNSMTTFAWCKRGIRNTCTNLHNKEMWVVNIELNRAEEILYPAVVSIAAIDEILVTTTNHHLGWGGKITNCQCYHYNVEISAEHSKKENGGPLENKSQTLQLFLSTDICLYLRKPFVPWILGQQLTDPLISYFFFFL